MTTACFSVGMPSNLGLIPPLQASPTFIKTSSNYHSHSLFFKRISCLLNTWGQWDITDLKRDPGVRCTEHFLYSIR